MKFKNTFLRFTQIQSNFSICLLVMCVAFYSQKGISQSETGSSTSSSTAINSSSNTLSLTDALLSSLKISPNQVESEQPKFQTSSWLAASPSAKINFLKGQKESTSDELELSLNLAIKSNFQRDIDQKLGSLDVKIRQQQVQLKNLYLSGLIREAVWGYKIAKAKQSYLLKKENILQQLKKNHLKLIAAGESFQYGLLLIRKEINKTQVERLTNRQEIDTWMEQYLQVTGLQAIPNIISENKIIIAQTKLINHPNVQLVINQWKQKSLSIQSTGSDATPWNLSLTTKSTEVLGVKEDQVGLSFEMPITLIQSDSQRNKNEWEQGKIKFDTDYKQIMLKLNRQMKQLTRQSKMLSKKEKLLSDSNKLSQLIMEQIDQLKAGNEMSQELVLRRVLEAIQTENDYAITKLQLQQNNAMIRQSAGISL